MAESKCQEQHLLREGDAWRRADRSRRSFPMAALYRVPVWPISYGRKLRPTRGENCQKNNIHIHHKQRRRRQQTKDVDRKL